MPTPWIQRTQDYSFTMPIPKFPDLIPAVATEEALKRIEEKLDRLLSSSDYVMKNGLWRK